MNTPKTTTESLYNKLAEFQAEAIIHLQSILKGEKVIFEQEAGFEITDTKGSVIISIDNNEVYTKNGRYNLWDTDLVDILFLCDELETR